MGFILIIFNLKKFAIAGERAKSYIRRANIVGKQVGKKGGLKRVVYKDSIIVNKYREVKNILGVSYNKEITREKSIRKKAKYK